MARLKKKERLVMFSLSLDKPCDLILSPLRSSPAVDVCLNQACDQSCSLPLSFFVSIFPDALIPHKKEIRSNHQELESRDQVLADFKCHIIRDCALVITSKVGGINEGIALRTTTCLLHRMMITCSRETDEEVDT